MQIIKSHVVSTVNFGRKASAAHLFRLPMFYALERITRRQNEADASTLRFAQLSNDHISNHLAVFGHYDNYRLQALFTWLRSQDLAVDDWFILDIGANIGIHSRFFADNCRYVTAFEPNPAVIPLLRYNLQSFQNIRIEPVGLSDTEGVLNFVSSRNNIGASHIVDGSDEADGACFAIDVTRLDNYIDQFDHVGLIKIDVEGHESNVINGGLNLIKLHKPFIVFEQNSTAFVNGVSHTIESLKECGYQKFVTVSEFPSSWDSANLIAQFFKRMLILPVVGERIEFRMYTFLPPGNYSMVVAIP